MKYKLKDCTLNITDGTHSTVMDDKMGEYFLLSCKNIKNGEIILGNNERRINKETLNKLRKRTNLQKGDVLITTVGTLGELAYIKQKNINYDFQRSVGILKPNTQIVKTEYLYYLLKNNIDKVINVARGAVQQCIFLSELKELEFEICSLEEQSKVIKILNNIDKKIELNNQINDDLYEIIQTQYNKFMKELIDYDVVKLKDIAIIASGKRPQLKGSEFRVPLIGASGIMSYTDSYNYDEDIITIGRVGTLGIVQRYFDKIWASDNTLTIRTDFKNVIENYMKNVDYIALNRGSTQPLITQTDVCNLEIKYNKKEFEKFENAIKNIREKIYKNEYENKTLGQLRDTLLPKLMNGEIDLDKI